MLGEGTLQRGWGLSFGEGGGSTLAYFARQQDPSSQFKVSGSRIDAGAHYCLCIFWYEKGDISCERPVDQRQGDVMDVPWAAEAAVRLGTENINTHKKGRGEGESKMCFVETWQRFDILFLGCK